MRMFDHESGKHYLVDTGADGSILPPSDYDRKHATRGEPLTAANGSNIPTFGQRTTTLRLGSRVFRWNFVVADVKRPILGADFLAEFNLLIDVHHRRLVDATTYESINAEFALLDVLRVFHIRPRPTSEHDKVIDEFPLLLTPNYSPKPPKHGVEYFIPTHGLPVFAKARRLSLEKLAAAKKDFEEMEKLAAAKKDFEEMEKLGIVRRSDSPWSSPLHVVPKPDGSWRPCGDYRHLNAVSSDDHYPIPRLQDFSAQLQDKTVFSKVDLVRGYYHIPVAAVDVPKTAIITPFGLWEFLRMPFGLKGAAQAFQRMMDRVTQGLKNIFVYLDDILVASDSPEQHYTDLRTLF